MSVLEPPKTDRLAGLPSAPAATATSSASSYHWNLNHPELHAASIDEQPLEFGRAAWGTVLRSLGTQSGTEEMAIARTLGRDNRIFAAVLDVNPDLWRSPFEFIGARQTTIGQLAAQAALESFGSQEFAKPLTDLMRDANAAVARKLFEAGYRPEDCRLQGCGGAAVVLSGHFAEIAIWGSSKIAIYSSTPMAHVEDGQGYWYQWERGENFRQVAARCPEDEGMWRQFEAQCAREHARHCNGGSRNGFDFGLMNGSDKFLTAYDSCTHSYPNLSGFSIFSDGAIPPHFRGYRSGLSLTLRDPDASAKSLIRQTRFAEQSDPYFDLTGSREATALVVRRLSR